MAPAKAEPLPTEPAPDKPPEPIYISPRVFTRLQADAADAFVRPTFKMEELTAQWVRKNPTKAGLFYFRMGVVDVGGVFHWAAAFVRPAFGSDPGSFKDPAKYHRCFYQHSRKMRKRAESLLRVIGCGTITYGDHLVFTATRAMTETEASAYAEVQAFRKAFTGELLTRENFFAYLRSQGFAPA